MTEFIRCQRCKGTKKIARIGGIVGECTACEGSGKMLASEKVAIAEVVADEVISVDLATAVADSVVSESVEAAENIVRIMPKPQAAHKAIYKRKKS